MFNISGGNAPAGAVVDLFDNGVSPTTGVNYGGFGVAVATSAISENYVAGGVTANLPEPSTWAMMLLGFAGLGFAGYRRSRKAADRELLKRRQPDISQGRPAGRPFHVAVIARVWPRIRTHP